MDKEIPEKIKIFVFGSNYQGRHGKGTALEAKKNHGAIYGQAYGIQGNSYAICTKDLKVTEHPSVPESHIIWQINKLYKFATDNPNMEFKIPYTLKPNLNGYSPKEMARMFYYAKLDSEPIIPKNILFNSEFLKLIREYAQNRSST